MDPLSLIETLEGLDLNQAASEVLEEKEEVIADLIATQLARSKKSDGSEILPAYAPLTVEIKKREGVGLGAVTDRVTTFMTGKHFDQLYADVNGNQIEYGSRVPYSDSLEEKYDTAKGSIHMPDEDSKEELIEGHLRSAWQQKIEEKTGLSYE